MTSITRLVGPGTTCLLVCAGMGYLPAQEEKTAPTTRETSLAFIKQHVIGKSVTCSITNKIASDAIETTFERRTNFANLTETKNGFTKESDGEPVTIKDIPAK